MLTEGTPSSFTDRVGAGVGTRVRVRDRDRVRDRVGDRDGVRVRDRVRDRGSHPLLLLGRWPAAEIAAAPPRPARLHLRRPRQVVLHDDLVRGRGRGMG